MYGKCSIQQNGSNILAIFMDFTFLACLPYEKCLNIISIGNVFNVNLFLRVRNLYFGLKLDRKLLEFIDFTSYFQGILHNYLPL